MSSKRSLKDLQLFLDYLGDKGLMAKATAQSRKAAATKILGILTDDEAEDVTQIDLDDVVSRFGHLHGRQYTPQSLVTYKSRLRSALDDFQAYLVNPLSFRPSLHAREKKAPTSRETSRPTAVNNSQQPPLAPRPSAAPMMADNIVPIAIRADLTVYVQGLPFDLSEREAKKISSVILAMALPGD